MKYLLWPFLRVTALVLLVLVTVFGFLRAVLRALTGANQIPPTTFSCLLQFLTLPIFVPIVLIYFVSARLYLEIIVLDVKFGFAKPEEGLRVAAQTPFQNYGYWHMRFFRRETQEEPSAVDAEELAPEVEISKAKVLEEMCQLEAMFRISLRGASRLTYAEKNIIARKVNPLLRSPFGPGGFPVTEEADEEKINEWLNHPLMNILLPDIFVMSMAAQTPIPVATMERILRKLLQEDYDMYWRMAEARVRSKKEEIEKVIFNQSLARPFPSTASTAESRPKPEVSEAEILEEIAQLLNAPLPDIFVMNIAAQKPIPVSTIERILREFLQEDYDMYWKMAEARVRSKKQA